MPNRVELADKYGEPIDSSRPLQVALYAADGSGALTASTDSIPVSGDVAAGATDGGNPVKIGGAYNSTLPTYTNGQRGGIQIDARGKLHVNTSAVSTTGSDGGANAFNTVAGTDAAGALQVVIARVRGEIFNGSTWDRQKKPSATSRIVSAANTTNATSAKGSAGDVFAIQGYNAAAAVRYLKLYNKATAPTVGTDAPVKTIALAPSAVFSFSFQAGYYFSIGIAYALTTGSADADTGALTAGDILGLNIDYQ